MPIIETHQLTKVFPGDIRAVDGIDFEVNSGEIFAFLGPNGAGKTTTIKMLNTLILPTSGTAMVAGLDVAKNAAEVRKRIGYTAQDVGVDEHATGKENLTLYGHFYRLDGKTIKERVKEIFDLVGLTGSENRMVSTYSGGMRKRLDLAMGLIHQPQVIFLDEPTTGLDPQTRASIWEYIRNLVKSKGMTIFLTTHYMEEADRLADRIAIIDLGKIIAMGTSDELKKSIGGDVVTVTPCEDKDEACKEFIRRSEALLTGKPFVTGTKPTDGELAVYVNDGASAIPNIMQLLSGQGIEVKTITMSRPSLDDVFLKYTGKTIRAQEGTRTTFAQLRRMRNRRQQDESLKGYLVYNPARFKGKDSHARVYIHEPVPAHTVAGAVHPDIQVAGRYAGPGRRQLSAILCPGRAGDDGAVRRSLCRFWHADGHGYRHIVQDAGHSGDPHLRHSRPCHRHCGGDSHSSADNHYRRR